MMNVNTRRRPIIVTYFKLGILLHLITIVEIAVIYFAFKYFHLLAWLDTGNYLIKLFLLICLVFPPLFPQCDARARFQNYKQMKDHLFLYGFQPRIIKPFSHSRCQRDAVMAAAEELGLSKECKAFYKQHCKFSGAKVCSYRLCQDSVLAILPFITKRKIKCDFNQFIFILKNGLS